MPEAGGRVDCQAEDHEQPCSPWGCQSKREITRTRIRVRTAMATQTREQGRYLGGRPPYGYRLADAGPHPNKAHAAWGRRAHRLEPDPETAPVVRWMFAQRLAGHSAARITRALNDAGVPCPSAADPERNPHRTGAAWTLRTVDGDPGEPPVHGPAGVEPAAHRPRPGRPGQHRAGHKGRCSDGTCRRAGSSPSIPRTPALVSEADFIAAQDATAPRGPAGPAARRYLLAGLLACGGAGGGWNRPGPTASPPTGAATATPAPLGPDPGRPKNTYIREDQILPHLAALAILLASDQAPSGRRRTAGHRSWMRRQT